MPYKTITTHHFAHARLFFCVIPANTKHLYNIYTTSAQCLRRWPNIAIMLYKCFVFAGMLRECVIFAGRKALSLISLSFFLNQILSSSIRPISSNNSKAVGLIFYHLEYEPSLICSLKDTEMGPIKKA